MTRFVVAKLLAVSAPVLGQGATTVRVPDEVSCGSCRIVMATVATLGDASGPGELANIPNGIREDGMDLNAAARESRGRIHHRLR